MKLHLLVLRTRDLEAMKQFYATLGAQFQCEQHGNGPEHYAATLHDGMVLELYPMSESAAPDPGLRIGLTVRDLEETLRQVGQSATPRETPWGLRALVRDPDGRAVELRQGHSIAS